MPDGATVSIDPIDVLWHQVESNYVQMTYLQYWTVNGQPDTLQVVKDLTYEGSGMLPYDMVLTISNISVHCDDETHVEHCEWDENLAPASSPIPTLSQWGLITMALLLLAFGTLYVRKLLKA